MESALASLTSPYNLVVGENKDLISLGPYPGMDFMEMVGKSVTKLGLEYMDDFFYFYGDFSSWARFSVALMRMDTP